MIQSMKPNEDHPYELVVGLEVHAQLTTHSKAFSSDPTEYGAAPNTQVSSITLGHPGTLPLLNRQVVEYAIRLGLALNCRIRERNEFARKNYFYADLPKGYQITQHTTPIATEGFMDLKQADGQVFRLRITRIHMEEDAGKSMHDQDPYDSLIDLNRCGVPLLEIVTEPDIRSAAQAGQYLTEMRRLLRYLEICDGNMEEGSMRCDANISVRKKGDTQFGTKVEVKNMNSIRHVQKAIEHEFERQMAMIESGQVISSETRSFDAGKGSTFALRSKEQANDYRYFPEPDLQPVLVTEDWKSAVRTAMPPLPAALLLDFTTRCGLSEYDAGVLTETKDVALYYNEAIKKTKHFKAAANWVMGPVKSWLNANALSMIDFPISAECLVRLTELVEEGGISHTAAVQKLFPALLNEPQADPAELANRMGLQQLKDTDELSRLAQEVLLAWPDKVAAYRSGKKGMIGLFMGELMKKSGGKADPKLATRLLEELLEG